MPSTAHGTRTDYFRIETPFLLPVHYIKYRKAWWSRVLLQVLVPLPEPGLAGLTAELVGLFADGGGDTLARDGVAALGAVQPERRFAQTGESIGGN